MRECAAVTPQLNGGARCPALQEFRVCNTKICKCSHIRCHFETHKATGRKRIFVEHDKNEFLGSKHVCGFNYDEQACECRCFNPTGPHESSQPDGYFNALDDAAVEAP